MLMHELLLKAAERAPERMAFRWVDRDRSISYAEMVRSMEAMAGALHALGVKKGDRVGVFAHNGMDYLIAMFGAWRVGAIAALVNVKFADELSWYFGDCTPSVVIYTHDMHDVVRRAKADVPQIKHLVCMDGPKDGAQSLSMMMDARLPPPADPWDETAMAHLSYTSGTTGRPKGACLAHEPTVRASRCIAERLRLSRDDVSFGATALSSSYQLVGNILPQMSQLCPVNVMRFWGQDAGYKALDEANASAFIANPLLLADLIAESRIQGKLPGKLRFALTGGGPMPPVLKAAFRDEFQLPIVESYGQSELGGFVALGYPELVAPGDDLTAVGPPPPDKDVRIVDANDRPVAPTAVGEIQLRGGFMAGYWGRPEATEAATRGGWLRTGDLGLIDRDGQIVMRARKSELVVVGGVSWYPRDIEEAMGLQPGVDKVAVVGLAGANASTVPVAFVTAKPGAGVNAAQLKDAVAGLLPYDLSALRIHVLEALPMTPTGKISKAELKTAFEPMLDAI